MNLIVAVAAVVVVAAAAVVVVAAAAVGIPRHTADYVLILDRPPLLLSRMDADTGVVHKGNRQAGHKTPVVSRTEGNHSFHFGAENADVGVSGPGDDEHGFDHCLYGTEQRGHDDQGKAFLQTLILVELLGCSDDVHPFEGLPSRYFPMGTFPVWVDSLVALPVRRSDEVAVVPVIDAPMRNQPWIALVKQILRYLRSQE